MPGGTVLFSLRRTCRQKESTRPLSTYTVHVTHMHGKLYENLITIVYAREVRACVFADRSALRACVCNTYGHFGTQSCWAHYGLHSIVRCVMYNKGPGPTKRTLLAHTRSHIRANTTGDALMHIATKYAACISNILGYELCSHTRTVATVCLWPWNGILGGFVRMPDAVLDTISKCPDIQYSNIGLELGAHTHTDSVFSKCPNQWTIPFRWIRCRLWIRFGIIHWRPTKGTWNIDWNLRRVCPFIYVYRNLWQITPGADIP